MAEKPYLRDMWAEFVGVDFVSERVKHHKDWLAPLFFKIMSPQGLEYTHTANPEQYRNLSEEDFRDKAAMMVTHSDDPQEYKELISKEALDFTVKELKRALAAYDEKYPQGPEGSEPT